MVLVNVVLMFILIMHNTNALKETSQNEFLRRTQVTLKLFTETARDAIFATDLATLEVIAGNLYKQHGIDYVYISDSSGSQLVYVGSVPVNIDKHPIDISLSDVTDGVYDVNSSIVEDGFVFANIRLGFAVNVIASAIDKTKTHSIVIASIGIIFIALFSYIFGLYVTRQFSILRKGVAAIEKGELGFQIDIIGKDEIARTATAFNSMSSELYINNLLRNAIMQSAIDCIITTNAHGVIEDINPAVKRTLGYSKKQALGLSICDLVMLLKISGHSNYNFRSFIESEGEVNLGERFESSIICSDGIALPVEMVVTKTVLSENEVFYIFYISDISDRKQAEKTKDEFISVVSHELRTPLTAILGGLGLLRNDVVNLSSEKKRSMLDIAINNSERLLELVNDLLDMQKIESGSFDLNLDVFNITEVVRQSIEQNEGYASKFNVKLNFIADEKPIWVDVDHSRILQVMANLLSNAVKFSPENGIVDITVIENKDLVYVKVSDNGPGVADEFKEKIFQKFSQADSAANRQYAGTGLGLPITKYLIEAHGGEIGLESNSSGGAAFYFKIKLSKAFSKEPNLDHLANIV